MEISSEKVKKKYYQVRTLLHCYKFILREVPANRFLLFPETFSDEKIYKDNYFYFYFKDLKLDVFFDGKIISFKLDNNFEIYFCSKFAVRNLDVLVLSLHNNYKLWSDSVKTSIKIELKKIEKNEESLELVKKVFISSKNPF